MSCWYFIIEIRWDTENGQSGIFSQICIYCMLLILLCRQTGRQTSDHFATIFLFLCRNICLECHCWCCCATAVSGEGANGSLNLQNIFLAPFLDCELIPFCQTCSDSLDLVVASFMCFKQEPLHADSHRLISWETVPLSRKLCSFPQRICHFSKLFLGGLANLVATSGLTWPILLSSTHFSSHTGITTTEFKTNSLLCSFKWCAKETQILLFHAVPSAAAYNNHLSQVKWQKVTKIDFCPTGQ